MTWIYDHTQEDEPATKTPFVCDYLEIVGETGASALALQYDTLAHDPTTTNDWLARVVSTPAVGTLSARQAIAVGLAYGVERWLGRAILQEADGTIVVLKWLSYPCPCQTVWLEVAQVSAVGRSVHGAARNITSKEVVGDDILAYEE